MKCPYCNTEFPLTWKRYLKAPFGEHICPSCAKRSKLILTPRYVLFFLVSVVLLYGGLTLFFHNLWGYQLYGLLLAIGIGTVVYIPVDRYVDDKLGKLDKPNVNKPNIILGNLKEILFVIFIVSLVAVILHLAEEIRYLPWRMADEAAEQGILKPRIDWDSPLLQQRKIIITSEINEIVSQRVVSQLLFLDSIAPTESVDLYLRTVGGNTGDMFAIIETFDLIKSEVNVYAIGDCSSAGAYILAAGTGKRFCTSATIIGIHINIDDSDEEWSRQRKGKERKIDFWNKHSELPKAFYPLKGNKFYFLNATEAKRFKIIDEIITHNKGRKPGEPTDSPESGY